MLVKMFAMRKQLDDKINEAAWWYNRWLKWKAMTILKSYRERKIDGKVRSEQARRFNFNRKLRSLLLILRKNVEA